MTSITKLPTTPGSIVTFTGWADKNKTEKFTYAVTLLAGDLNDSQADNLVWGDAYTDAEGNDTFSEEQILAGDPKLLHEAASNPRFIGLVGETPEARFGEVVIFKSEDGDHVTATYTPGFIDSTTGEPEDSFWVNSYGSFFKFEEILAGDPQVIAKGL